jgi:hypothetical protein
MLFTQLALSLSGILLLILSILSANIHKLSSKPKIRWLSMVLVSIATLLFAISNYLVDEWALFIAQSIACVGALFNISAVGFNNWKMPVNLLGWEITNWCTDERLESMNLKSLRVLTDLGHRHSLMTASTRVKLLCDVIPLSEGYFSIGDLFLRFAILIFAASFFGRLLGYALG